MTEPQQNIHGPISPLRQLIHAKLAQAFGSSASSENRDNHWSLKPAEFVASINILVDGSSEIPAIWVFDPHSVNDGVIKIAIEREEQIEQVIQQVKDHLHNAQRSHDGR
jgi:hypothetical protein